MSELVAVEEARAALEAAKKASIRRWPVMAIDNYVIGLKDGEIGLATSLELAHHAHSLKPIEVDGFDPATHDGGPIKQKKKAKEVAA